MPDATFELYRDDGDDGLDDDAVNDTLIGGSCYDGTQTFSAAQVTGGTYYVKVKGTSADAGTYFVSVKDEDGTGALDCADGAATSGATISRTEADGNRLPAGTYYVGITSQSTTTGDYQIGFSNPSLPQAGAANYLGCAAGQATLNVTNGGTYYAVVKGASATQSGSYGLTITDTGLVEKAHASCAAQWNDAAPDAWVDFTVADSGADNQSIEVALSGDLAAVYQLENLAGDTVYGCSDTAGANPTST